MSGAALPLNSSTIGISFDRMNAAKRKLGRAQEEAQAEKDSLSRAISSLQVEDGRLRQKAEALNRLRSKVSNRVAGLQRVGSHVDYAVQRFTEVDNQCAQKIKTGGYEARKTVGISNQGGIFGNILGGLVSIADKGKAAWEKATNWVKDHKSEILKGLAIGLIAAASIALGVVTLGASVPAELALLSLLGGGALIGGGVSLGMAEAVDLLGDGTLNLSAKQYLGAYAGGAFTGATLPLGGELLPAANAIWSGTCAMTGNAIEQYIGTGKVDHSQTIMTGASAGVFSYGLNKLIPVLTGRGPSLKIPSMQANKAAALESQTAKETSSFRFFDPSKSRGVRNSEILTEAQQAQLYKHIEEMGLNPDDFLISSHMSAYSDLWDKTFLGPNMFPAATRAQRSVFETMTPRAAVAHEAGHMITTRNGTAFEAGSLYDEVSASLTARKLPGLNNVERYQLLRDAVERAKINGTNLRDALSEMGGK